MTTPPSSFSDDKPFPEHLLMPATPVLETERLVLRPLRESDAPVVQRRFPQWEIVQYLHDEVPWPYPDDGAAVNMAQCAEKMARRQQCYWAITLKGGDDELIGRIDLWADDGVRRDQRGFWLDPEFWGRGLMTEAANRVTDFALVELGWPHLWLSNAEANTASHRVKEKQGATVMDRTPRGYVSGPGIKVSWLLTREAWLAHKVGPRH
jgi:[ribosomal protein S5]-alanine N-acetyltransferase